MDIGYVNARVRGMHSFLLTRKQLNSLILKPDIDSLITELENTPYRKEIGEALVTTSGIKSIETALRNNLVRTFHKILLSVKGETGERYIRIFLGRWDVYNIKTILRGKKFHISSPDIRDCLIPAGDLDEPTLIEMIKQPDIKAVIDLLAAWGKGYAIPLTRNFEEFNQRSDLVILEYSLDQYYYNWALSQVRGPSKDEVIIRNLVEIEIDITNLKSILSLHRDAIDPEEGDRVLLDGGKVLDRNELLEMAGEPTTTDLLSHLEYTPYRFMLDLKTSENTPGRMSVYQNALDTHLIRKGTKTFRGDPLSVTIVIGYLWEKYTEIINLRIIARCKNVMVTPEEMETELIYV